jgi:hypothetical protein
VDATLPVKVAAREAAREHPFVPDVGVDIESAGAVKPERLELLRPHVISRQRQGNHERFGSLRVEQLATIGVIVGMPQQ